MKILLNRFDDPRLSDRIFVGKGDKVYALASVEEFGFTVGKEYEVQDVSQFEYLVMKNDEGEIEEYSVEFFSKYEPLVLSKTK